MNKMEEAVAAIEPLDEGAMERSQKRWDSIAKPLKSLGLLETAVIRLAGIFQTEKVSLGKRCVVPMCADNGVVAQGVTQTGSEVTAVVTENFAKGDSSVCCMARCVHADVIPVDIGVARDLTAPGIWNRKIRYGTADMTQTAAMTREEAVRAVETGIQVAEELKKQGYRIIATGEMGIGNTTTSSALASLLLDLPVEQVTGYGAGLSNEGLTRKIDAIHRAINLNRPDPGDPLDMLSKVGGLDIAGMVGIYLGCAAYKIPVLIDGMISAVAALLAVRMVPLSRQAMLPSHVSKEPAGKILLDALGFEPLLTCDMCLGEGTGGIAALGLIDMALAVYRGMCTFDETEIDPYQDLRKPSCSH